MHKIPTTGSCLPKRSLPSYVPSPKTSIRFSLRRRFNLQGEIHRSKHNVIRLGFHSILDSISTSDSILDLQVTYHFFHWKKGTPFADDQGIYNRLTWWEQIDSGKQLTCNRKFLTVVPVVLKINYGVLSEIKGLQAQVLLFWLNIDEIRVDVSAASNVYFTLGSISQTLDIKQFQRIHP
ncbi:ORMDL-like protein [Cynara cardunculus var. scolymus]|uniref:ORMDL-like protein n=1 Tax=Cynara cardunculus var. scolymus TaxID=59895 RepID=A0A103Y7L7_CYNCS|nr:ORMDL-like protein [Cynara cardunculus var. scolymus]